MSKNKRNSSTARVNCKIAWVHNFPTHYTEHLFEIVGQRLPVEYLFFGQGRERWFSEHRSQRHPYCHQFLKGFRVLGTDITPLLPLRLLAKNYAAVVKCINGRVALPISYVIAKLRRKPFILYTGVWMQADTPMRRLGAPVFKHIYRHADAIIAYGEHVKSYLITEGANPDHIFVERHAVDNNAYNRLVTEEEKRLVRESLRIPCDAKVVLYVGRLEAAKGLDYLMTAFSQLRDPKAVLIPIGTGSEEQQLKHLTSQLGLSGRVSFAGYVPPLHMARYYAVAWTCVLPSITTRTFKEPWGVVVNEAFNQATPVIATEAVGAAAGGLIEHGVNGFIVPERDARALTDALDRMLAAGTLRNDMGAAAFAKVSSWNHESAADVIEAAIRFALGSARQSDRS